MAECLDSVSARHLVHALLSDPGPDPLSPQRQQDWADSHLASALGPVGGRPLLLPAGGPAEERQTPSRAAAVAPAPGAVGRQDAGEEARARAASPRSSLLRLIEQEEAELDALVGRVRTIRTAMTALAAEFDAPPARQARRECAEAVVGREEIDALLVEAGRSARREVLAMNHPLAVTAQVLDRAAAAGPGRAPVTGPAARVLHLASTARTPQGHLALHAMRDAGADVRLTVHTPLRLLIVDSSLAVLERVEQRALPAALLLCGRDPVEVVREVFEYCWLSARPLHAFSEQPTDAGPAPRTEPGPAARPDPPEPNEQQRAVLLMLTNGMKDEAIARQLGISVRTLGRLIGALMTDLQVSSRYQLGVQATVLGWVR